MKRNKKYFTLAELVIILGVMFISFSLSGFFISKAKRDAKAVKCAENLFRMGKATFKYAADNKGFLPYAGEGHDSWKLQIAPYMGIKDPAVKANKEKFSLFHCPADVNKMPAYMEKDPFYLGKMSYCANLYVMDAKYNDLNNDGFMTTRKLNSIDGPDTVILYAENHNRNNVIGSGLSLNWNRNKSEFTYPEAAKKGYHAGSNNYLLLDGGVEFYTYNFTLIPEDLWLLKYGTSDL
jgi:hypothetical protein